MKKWSWLLGPAIVIALAAAPAIAGGKGGGTNSVALHRYTDAARTATSSSEANFGEQVTFDVTSSVSQPYVLAECFQDGTRVYAELHGFWSGYMFGTVYTLGPTQVWQSGGADCTASLVDQSRSRTRVLATTSFHVNDPGA
jgi:hypothetical protein